MSQPEGWTAAESHDVESQFVHTELVPSPSKSVNEYSRHSPAESSAGGVLAVPEPYVVENPTQSEVPVQSAAQSSTVWSAVRVVNIGSSLDASDAAWLVSRPFTKYS